MSSRFTDNGTDQVVTMSVGVAAKRDVLVPNPVALAPYRTFQEVEQPVSEFIFQIGDKEQPNFKLVEAQNGIWRNEAIQSIREYLLRRTFPDAERNWREGYYYRLIDMLPLW